MYNTLKPVLEKELSEIKEAGLYKRERIISSPQGADITLNDGSQVINFYANNYLGLSSHPKVIEAAKKAIDSHGFGMSSVRFICGTQDIHKKLEQKISEFLGTEDTILYAAAFDANGGVFEPLFDERDAIISDSLNHASIIDGVRLCKAQRFRYNNNDMAQLEQMLQETQNLRHRIIVTDGVFSMDGSIAQLDKIVDLSKDGNYEFYDKTMEIYESRIAQNQVWFKEILSQPMEFTSNETYTIDDKQPYTKNDIELKERLRKSLKYAVMTRLATSLETQEAAELRKDTIVKILSMDSLEARARKGVLKSQQDFVARWNKVKPEEKLSYYINSITSVFDPHTNYFPPADKENFDISMSGRLEGIGASLQEKDGYIKVMRIVPGSPSALQGELKEGDIILKVAQGANEPVDVVNMPMDDAIKMIRGSKGTEVRLTVKKPDGSTKVIKIIRDVVILDETFAKSAVIEDNDHNKTGYLYLPTFYTDMNGNGGRTSWEDVRMEIKKLKRAGVGRIVFDLRNNGGGSLQDVVSMSGLFIEKGPIVQVKTRGEQPEFLEDHDPSVEWDGPLVLMVNQFSASASEILAAAMQDYKRAVIVGSNHTFGKGTVQRFIDLNETVRSKDAAGFGSVKITIQKFYRIDGGATQLKGVLSDIVLPDNFTYLKSGEAEEDFPMVWDKIEPANYKMYDKYSAKLASAKTKSAARVKESSAFTLIDENAKRIKLEEDKKEISLNLKIYMAEEKLKKEQSKKLENVYKENEQLIITTLEEDKKDIESDKGKSERVKDWHKNLKKDPYIFEALQIAEDL